MGILWIPWLIAHYDGMGILWIPWHIAHNDGSLKCVPVITSSMLQILAGRLWETLAETSSFKE